MTIGTKIRMLRRERNMTQKELAEKSGLALVTIGQYETDKYKPKIEQREKLAAALNVSPDEINTENYWRDAAGNITVQIPNILDADYSYRAIKKEKEKNLNLVIKTLKKRDFQSDLLIDIVSLILKMNPKGQTKVYEYVTDISELPKYKKDTTPNDVTDVTDRPE